MLRWPAMPPVTTTPRIRKSPFYDATVAAGATTFTVYNKMFMPLSYGDLSAEYERLITTVAPASRGPWGSAPWRS